MKKPNLTKIENQIIKNQRRVDYDIKEFTIELIVNKYITGLKTNENEIFVPPYQRDFVWERSRQSKFIESVILGLPIPYIFTAENDDGRMEIVDGSQRIRTLSYFLGNTFSLDGLEFLTELEGVYFNQLSPERQRKIKNTSLRMIVLSEHSDEDARYMLFERINTGSVTLTSMQKRKGSYHEGKFLRFIYLCSKDVVFKEVTRFTEIAVKRGEPQELILRFFAFSEEYESFSGNINDFLTDFLKRKNKSFDRKYYRKKFKDMLAYVRENFPNGFVKESHYTNTPRVRFEALSVGVSLAIEKRPQLPKRKNPSWLKSVDFERQITGPSTNTVSRVRTRIEYVKNKLLDNN